MTTTTTTYNQPAAHATYQHPHDIYDIHPTVRKEAREREHRHSFGILRIRYETYFYIFVCS